MQINISLEIIRKITILKSILRKDTRFVPFFFSIGLQQIYERISLINGRETICSIIMDNLTHERGSTWLD